MKKELENEYRDIFVTAEKNGKKKGGSLGAVFKLIQELAEFEAKIQECADAQEMAQNKEQIMAFADQLDQMYDVLFKMGRTGIQEVRGGREQIAEEVEGVEDEAEEIVEQKQPVMLNVPQIPKM